ncbi:MAG: heavy-metal-associated domain-containing protein [Chloroflexia bacterium]|nr:heavy-metal-associated domain-containing protein [Chloroflexia bacterium]
MDRIELPVGGVTCGGCAGRVSKALLAVPGVATALVNDDRSQVTIEGAALERHVLVAAIQDAGYQVLAPTMIALGADNDASCCGGNAEGCC